MSDKIEQFWRDSTADDVARVMKGEKVEARFRDEDYEEWRDGEFLGGLRAFRSIPLAWIDLDGVQWAQCKVYEPQQWWLDKPDPGEGWRLLDPFKEKNLEKFDEFFCTATKAWRQSANAMLGKDQQPETWYRRRIGPNNPEKLDSCVDHLEVGKEYRLPNGQGIKVTKKGFELE